MIALLFASLLGISNAYEYYAGPKTFAQAKEYCDSIGSELAVIVSDADRAAAKAEIPAGVTGVWIGLEDTSDSKKGFFLYPTEPASVCPLPDSGACVDFWIDGEPLCVEKKGFECVQFYQDALAGEGGVNNDVDCETRRPFLCNDSPIQQTCTDNLDYNCGSNGQAWVRCGYEGVSNICFCDKSDVSIGEETFCVENYWCSSAQRCSTTSQCPATFVCTPDSCCGSEGYCVPKCGEDLPRRRLLIGEEEWAKYEESRRKLIPETQEICTTLHCPGGNPAAQAELFAFDHEHGSKDLNGLSVTTWMELLGMNVIVSILSSAFVILAVYICCLRQKSSTDKVKYNKVGDDNDDEDVEMM